MATSSEDERDHGPGVGFDSVTVVASDFARSLAFYDAAMTALGVERVAEFGDEEEDAADVEAAAWATASGTPVLWLVTGSPPTSGAHVTLRTALRAGVDGFFAAASGAGGTPRSAPRRWVIFRRGMVSAAVDDPDGNTLEVIAPE